MYVDMICTPRPPTYGKNSMQHILLFKSIPVFEQLQDQNGQYVIAAEFRHGVVAADFVRYKIDHSDSDSLCVFIAIDLYAFFDAF